jgi:hypothetical protein
MPEDSAYQAFHFGLLQHRLRFFPTATPRFQMKYGLEARVYGRRFIHLGNRFASTNEPRFHPDLASGASRIYQSHASFRAECMPSFNHLSNFDWCLAPVAKV